MLRPEEKNIMITSVRVTVVVRLAVRYRDVVTAVGECKRTIFTFLTCIPGQGPICLICRPCTRQAHRLADPSTEVMHWCTQT